MTTELMHLNVGGMQYHAAREAFFKATDEFLEMTTEVVHLNVGGLQYYVARDTLLRAPDTFLDKLVSEKWTIGHKQDTIYIDRDGEKFRYILDWYRDGKIIVPKTVALKAIRTEADFYGLPAETIIEKDISSDRIPFFDGAKFLDELSAQKDKKFFKRYNIIS